MHYQNAQNAHACNVAVHIVQRHKHGHGQSVSWVRGCCGEVLVLHQEPISGQAAITATRYQ